MKSMRMIELRTTMPARAIMPIIAVAVKKIGVSYPPTGRSAITLSSQKPGMMPIIVRGMAAMMISGITSDPVSTSSRMKISTSAAAKAIPRSRKTSRVICHSPSPFHTTRDPSGRG